MTLTFRPGGANWDHAGYRIFRERLAALDGVDLMAMPGYAPVSQLDWDNYPSPVEDLLRAGSVHGHFRADQCRRMLPRLQAVLALWSTMPDPDRFVVHDLAQLPALIKGMGHCTEHGCALVWGEGRSLLSGVLR